MMKYKKETLKFIAFFIIELLLFLPFYVADIYAAEPSITNLNVQQSYDSATVTWQTDVASDSLVKYGKNNLLELSVSNPQQTTSHSIVINPLSPNTAYYYSVKSCNGADCKGSSISNFQTQSAPAPEKIVGLTNGTLTKHTLILEWNISSTPYFSAYNIYRNGNKITNITSKSNTQYTDTGLSSGTTYQYEVSAVNIDGLEGQKSDSFYVTTTAQDTTAPFIENASITSISKNSATISWTTDEESNSTIRYGTSMSNLNLVKSSSNQDTKHMIVLDNLVNSTAYFYKIISCDLDGNCAEKADMPSFVPTQIQQLNLQINVPAIYNNAVVRVTGTAAPHTRVKFYVNDIYKAMLSVERNTNGNISFDVPGFVSGNNTLRAVVEDSIGNTLEKKASVKIDLNPPLFSITEIPSIVSSKNLILNGSSNEPINIKVYIKLLQGEDTTAPGTVTNFHSDKVEQNRVSLAWTNINDSDFKEYIIYRNDMPIATAVNSPFVDDEMVNSGASYRYEIAAVDTSCNIGPKAVVNVQTTIGGVVYNGIRPTEPIDCLDTNKNPDYILTSQYPNFREDITLKQGLNDILVEISDEAGNKVTKSYHVYYDSEKPEILDTNLDKDSLTPSYTRDFAVTGTVSEDSYVCIYINSEPPTKAYRSNEVNESYLNSSQASRYCRNSVNKTFSIDIELRRDADYAYDAEHPTTQTQSGYVNSGTAWRNNLKIIATDSVGLKSDPVDKEIMYSLCGGGGDWSMLVSDVMPTEIVPRHLLEGMAQLSFSVDLTWRGSGPKPGITDIDLSEGYPMGMSSDLEEKYDLISRIPDPSCSDEFDKCFVLIDLKAQDPFQNQKNKTVYEKEENLSKHHQGQCFNMPFSDKDQSYLKSAGCVRLPLTLVINYEKTRQVRVNNRYETRKEKVTQKECVDVEVLIQPRIPPDIIPNSFLKSSVEFLNTTINLIDQILEPLEKVLKATMIACFAMWIVLYLKKISEGFSCKGMGIFSSGDKGCKCTVTEAGVSSCIKDGQENDDCKSCVEAKINTKKFEKYMAWVCDRIMCPSVPSYEKYIKDNINNPTSNCYKKQDVPNKYDTDTNSDTALCNNAPKSLVGNLGPIKRPDNNQCCDEEYMQQWNSGCVMMNELTESNKLANPETEGAFSKIWRSVSSFKLCRPGDTTEKQININGQWFIMNRTAGYDQLSAEQKNKTFEWTVWDGISKREKSLSNGQVINDTETIEIRNPKNPLTGTSIKREYCNKYGVEPKYKYGDFFWPKYTPYTSGEIVTTNPDIPVNLTQSEKESTLGKEKNYTEINGIKYQYKKENDEYVLQEGSNYVIDGDKVTVTLSDTTKQTKTTKSEFVPETIVRDACSGFAEDYLVDPTEGIFRSIQCVCISALYSYLKMYRKILGLIKDCFQTILVTGDGSSGVCRAVLSYYVCDLLYYMFSCFKGYTGFGTKGAEEGGVLGFFKGIVGAGAEVQQSVEQRYGTTNMFRVMFIDKKIIHSVCLSFFGIDSDLDLTAMAEQGMNIPINSVVSVFPANRRFVGFNPIDGITNHIYHAGLAIVSGSDNMKYNVYLVCSNNNQCDKNYFKDGYCDCSRLGGERTKDITNEFGGKGSLNQGETLDQEAYVTVSYTMGDEAHYRYDKVRVEYEYLDNTGKQKKERVERELSQIGSSPLASCSFDIIGGIYKCGVFTEPTTACILSQPVLNVKDDKGTTPVQDSSIYSAVDPSNIKNKNIVVSFTARRQTSTGDTSKKFYATLDIKDGSNIIASVDQIITSETDQNYVFDDSRLKITDRWFSGTAGVQSCSTVSGSGIQNVNVIECPQDAKITCTHNKNTKKIEFTVGRGQYTSYPQSAFAPTSTQPQKCTYDYNTQNSNEIVCDGYRIQITNPSDIVCNTELGIHKLTATDINSYSSAQSKALTYTLTMYRPQTDNPSAPSKTIARCSGQLQQYDGSFTIYRGENPNAPGSLASQQRIRAGGGDAISPIISDFKINNGKTSKEIGIIPIAANKTAKLKIFVDAMDPADTSVTPAITASGVKSIKLRLGNNDPIDISSNLDITNTPSTTQIKKDVEISLTNIKAGFYPVTLIVNDDTATNPPAQKLLPTDANTPGVWFGDKCGASTDNFACGEINYCNSIGLYAKIATTPCPSGFICCGPQ